MELTHISLFAGIGGIDIAAEWAGFRTILFVEIDPFCQKVLRKHWPAVPIIGDVRDVTKEVIANATIQRPYNQENKQRLEEKGSHELHIKQPRDTKAVADATSQREPKETREIQRKRQSGSGNRKRFRNVLDTGSPSSQLQSETTESISPVTLITGGFPCQPVSQAGKRRGKEDDRWLWPEMLGVILDVRPTWVVAENVTGLLTMGFYDCLSDLEGAGYETIPFVIPACGVNAPHRRDRIFIVAHYESSRLRPQFNKITDELLSKDRTSQEFESSCGNITNTCKQRLAVRESIRENYESECSTAQRGDWWAVEPDVGRVAHGIPNRVDRLRGLGNAVVPQQIYPILQAIADIEIKHSTRNVDGK